MRFVAWPARYRSDTYPTEGHHNRDEKLFKFGELTPVQTFDLERHSGVTYQ